jgi:hypothetical protein
MLLAERRARHARISDFLASRSDADLAALTSTDGADVIEVRRASVAVEVDGVPVFAKRVPLTDLELAHPRSTANLFDLPMFCHFFFGVPAFPRFGFGGPAMNAWRELAANLIITEGVLAGETVSFPVLYHWRVLPIRPLITAEPSDVDAVVAALDGSLAVRNRLEALRSASHSLVLFSEYIPQPLAPWLTEDPASKDETFERQLVEAGEFLRGRQLLHLDGQIGNMRTDGDRLYLIDFGLATSPRFDLTPSERDFVESIATHDSDYASLKLVNWLGMELCGVPDPKTIDPETGAQRDWRPRAEFLRRCAAGDLPDGLPVTAVAILNRHAAVAWRTFSFYRRLINEDIHTPYPSQPQSVS